MTESQTDYALAGGAYHTFMLRYSREKCHIVEKLSNGETDVCLNDLKWR